jgi:hypothetical protein
MFKFFMLYFQTAIIETNPYLLAMTIIVSIVHSVFEFLAFKNGKYMIELWMYNTTYNIYFSFITAISLFLYKVEESY